MNTVTQKPTPIEIIKANKLVTSLIVLAYCVAGVVGIILWKLNCQGILKYTVLGGVSTICLLLLYLGVKNCKMPQPQVAEEFTYPESVFGDRSDLESAHGASESNSRRASGDHYSE